MVEASALFPSMAPFLSRDAVSCLNQWAPVAGISRRRVPAANASRWVLGIFPGGPSGKKFAPSGKKHTE